MNKKLCLIDTGSYHYQQTKLKNGSITPYIVRFPTNPNEHMVASIAQQAINILDGVQLECPVIFGIAKSGIPIAQIVSQGLRQKFANTRTITLDPYNAIQVIPKVQGICSTIIVDNAVTSGQSLLWAKKILEQNGYSPRIAIRFFDREEVEPNGLSQVDYLKDAHNISLLSLFCVRDLLPIVTKPERKVIIDHLMLSGTTELKEFLEKNNVFTNNSWSPNK